MNMFDNRIFLPSNLDDELVNLYRAWDELERDRYKNTIIDFDLASPTSFEPVESREKILNRIEALLSEFIDRSGAVFELIRARLLASRTYLQSLLGIEIPFYEYVEKTMGIKPVWFDENLIIEKKKKVNNSLKKFDLELSVNDIYSFQDLFLIRNQKSLIKQFEFYRQKWLPGLLKWLSLSLDDYDIVVKFASEDAYWKNWISGTLHRHEIELQINVHPRHKWYQGASETLVLHEYCGHAVQMIKWHQEIEQGSIPQFFGILTVHFPDQFIIEGLAETLAYLLPTKKKLESKSEVLRDLHYYTLVVMNNVHILANEPQGEERAFGYASERLPFFEAKSIRADIRDRTRNPLFRSYQYVYGIAKHSFLEKLARLDPGTSRDLLKLVYARPMTPNQFQEIYEELRRIRSIKASR